MRVALDLSPVRQAEAGVARYARGVAAALAVRPDVQLVRLGEGPRPPRGSARQRLLALRQDLIDAPAARRGARRADADVLHATTLRGPLRRGRPPLVLTVHDLAVLREPGTLGSWNRRYTRAVLRPLVGAADRLVAVSDDTARDLSLLLDVAPERIAVVPNGVDARFFGPPPPAPLDGPYVLFVGTPEPRKNLHRLAEAVDRLRRSGRRERLVVAGADGWGDALPAGSHVEALGRVDDATLHALLGAAACLAVPSLHEGFGLPAAEAMAAGCPVVAAATGALPWVCGDAAVLVDPLDVASIADGIERAIDEAEDLRRRGRERARAFGWPATAAGLVAVYRQVLERR